MTQSVVTAGMDFMTNGIIRPNGLASTVAREANHLKKSFSNNNVDNLHKGSKTSDDDDAATTSSSAAIKTTSDKGIEKAGSSYSVIEIIDESRSPEQPQRATTEIVEDDPCIQSIMDLSLPSPMSNGNMDECKRSAANPWVVFA